VPEAREDAAIELLRALGYMYRGSFQKEQKAWAAAGAGAPRYCLPPQLLQVQYVERHDLSPALSPLFIQAWNTHVYVMSRALGLWRCHERDDEPPLQDRGGAHPKGYQ
jgi:hypothetical protein